MANGQYTFTDMEYAARKRATRKDEFLRQMDNMIPWTEWVEMIRPYYPKGERGRPVRGIETMTRMYMLQMWFNLSDEGVEDTIYDSYAIRSFLRNNFIFPQTVRKVCHNRLPDCSGFPRTKTPRRCCRRT